jgi:hypothetical protein
MIKGFINRYFYHLGGINKHRWLGWYPAICDLCDKPVNFHDSPYMCREHTVFYYQTWRKYFPKFIFRKVKK